PLGQEVHGTHLARGAPVIRVFGHSNNLKCTRMFKVVTEVFANGVTILEILLLKEAIYQGDRARPRRVLFVAGPAFDNFGTDGVKVFRAPGPPCCTLIGSSRGWRRIALNINTLTPVVSFHGTVKRKADLLNAGNSVYILVELAVKRLQLLRLVSRHLWINMQNVSVGRVKAEVPVLHIVQAAGEQAGRAKQDQ